MTENISQITPGVKPPKIRFRLILTTVLLSSILLFSIGYLDFEVITPLILPEDYCYYHTHEIPWWVELFYMSPANNGHPYGSFFI